MNILGVESSCDETGVALVHSDGPALPQLRAHALHSQIEMHQAYGGVVPELASRDHIRRVLPLTRHVMSQAGVRLSDVDVVAYTRGPGLAGALLVGAGVACALAAALASGEISKATQAAVAARRDKLLARSKKLSRVPVADGSIGAAAHTALNTRLRGDGSVAV